MFNKAKNENCTEVTNMKIGRNISALRKEKGITQEGLASELGVSAQAVSKWENNSSCPDISLLPDIADYFGVTVDSLLRSDEKEIINDKSESSEHDTGKTFSGNYSKNVNIKIIQQNGKENNIKIPFKFVKTGLGIAGFFGLEKQITDRINSAINNEDITEIIKIDAENGEHIIITLI